MFKTEEQINERLSSKKNLVNRFVNVDGSHTVDETSPARVTVIPLQQPGNKEKSKLDPDAKNEIAVRARLGEKQKDLAKEFGVSQSAIGEIEQGRTKVNESLVQQKLDEVTDVAMNKLLESLGFITTEKLDKTKATDLSSIAANMSKVVNNVRGKSNEGNGPQVNIQIYAPELKSESSFKTIEV